MKYYIFSLLITIMLISCEKDDLICLPSCLLEKVASLEKFDCEKASITTYLFEGSLVYFIDPGYCLDDDGSYEIMDRNCEVVGLLGGWGSNEKINGLHFFENAKLLSIVWEKE